MVWMCRIIIWIGFLTYVTTRDITKQSMYVDDYICGVSCTNGWETFLNTHLDFKRNTPFKF